MKYTLPSLPKKPLGYGTITLEDILKHFRKVRHYMYVYLEGLKPGAEVDEAIKIASKSLGRIEPNDQLLCPLLLYNFTSELTTNKFFS